MTSDLESLIQRFSESLGCDAAVWMDNGDNKLIHTAGALSEVALPAVESLPQSEAPIALAAPHENVFVAALPASVAGWLAVRPNGDSRMEARSVIGLLSPIVAHVLQTNREVEHAALELAERYEEINLLYTISEILGRTVTLEEAAGTILKEIAETVGARRGAILVHDRATDTLHAVVARPELEATITPISVDNPDSASAQVFRSRHPLIVGEEELTCAAERPYRRGQMLSVPIQWTAPDGPVTLGVVNLSDRRSREQFTAGDLKLIAAIATQIGTAIQNSRLVRESLSQQRLMQEMRLAHDLQMRLLPDPRALSPVAEVAARVVPAESVGGDFYHLFRLGEGRVGIMLGDVSSHGYRAALIMALAMSASAIHARDTADPAEVLAALLDSLHEELTSTEMFISLFYCVVDRRAGELRYANAGHPHAFLVSRSGTAVRLGATDPPLGMVDSPPRANTVAWTEGDLLLLFTDGLSDARNKADDRLGEDAVLELVAAEREAPVGTIVDLVFRLVEQHAGTTPRRDDLTLVVARS
ncbi:MAG TPA: GAF domain-containing SpoIIE family protein phosphatase [Gemmatimonadales bacterium]|nr:GAF domain-containing SpoIIE family protein phosphatase [Gemmatimonadales bacterium]